MVDPTQAVLLYFIVPLWFLSGVADWWCHRASDIEHTAGVKESLIHLLMYAELAVPLLACLFLEVNALIILVIILAFLAHEATALWDVSYAVKHRRVTPLEQHVHSFLELIPLMAGAFVILLNWSQFLALFGFGEEPARFELAWKDPPLPTAYIVAVLAASVILALLPYVEELWRCLRAAGGRLAPPRAR